MAKVGNYLDPEGGELPWSLTGKKMLLGFKLRIFVTGERLD